MTSKQEMPFTFPKVRQTGLSRRNFLRGVGAGGAAVAGAGLLGACSSSSGGSAGAANTDPIVNVANWPLYIDTKRVNGQKTYPTIAEFQNKTGIKVSYTEPVNDNEEFFAKIRPILAANKDTGYDVFMLTDWMASKLISLGWLEKLDKTNIPNFKNVLPALQHPTFDPNRDYSIPWQSGLTGIAYDAAQTSPVTSVTQLLTDSSLAGSVTVLTEMRDTMGLVMLSQGNDPATFTQDAWDSALQAMQSATDANQFRAYTGNNYAQSLAKGDIKACMAWSGDVVQLQFDNPNIKFVVPDDGAMLWSDNMLIPNQAQHKANAEAWMNFYYDPKVAAQLSAWVAYICPVEGAQAEMMKIDKSLANNPLIFPTKADLAKLSIFRALTDAEDTQYTQQFQALYT